MGYIAHDAVVVTVSDYVYNGATDEIVMPDVEAFKASMPEELRPLLVGPIPAVINGGATYFFAPDGSKEGWETSDLAEEWRERFIDLFTATYGDGSSPFAMVAVRFGGDYAHEVGATFTKVQPEH